MSDVVNFFNGVRAEFAKVIWPKRGEFVGSTIVVLFLMVVFAVSLFFIDQFWGQVMRYTFRSFGL